MAQLYGPFEQAIRTWLRGAELAEIVLVLEVIREELATRHMVLTYTTDYRAPGQGR